jgi:hypothetical protein
MIKKKDVITCNVTDRKPALILDVSEAFVAEHLCIAHREVEVLLTRRLITTGHGLLTNNEYKISFHCMISTSFVVWIMWTNVR